MAVAVAVAVAEREVSSRLTNALSDDEEADKEDEESVTVEQLPVDLRPELYMNGCNFVHRDCRNLFVVIFIVRYCTILYCIVASINFGLPWTGTLGPAFQA